MGKGCQTAPRGRGFDVLTISAVLVLCFTSAITAQELGVWDPVQSWGTVEAVHMVHLPTGKILLWTGHGGVEANIYDPVSGILTPVPSTLALFCAGHATLADGRLLIAGGGQEKPKTGLYETAVFDQDTNGWTRLHDMAYGRWYPTLTTLSDGRVLALSGNDVGGAGLTKVPEIYDPSSDTWTDLDAASKALMLYPRTFLAPDGRLIVLNAFPLTLNLETETWKQYKGNALKKGSAVSYAPGKVMAAGGHLTGPKPPSVKDTWLGDFTVNPPQFRNAAPMAFARDEHNLVILPDGMVLAVGGSENFRDEPTAVYAAELWNPETETWTTLASMQVARLYHSTAILLQDGRVLSAGGNGKPNSQIFNPPYLYKGPRPSIGSAPASGVYGSSIVIATPQSASVAKVSLLRTGAVTHGFDSNQRFMWLDFTKQTGSLTVQLPNSPNLAPPGVYLLFLISDLGVPSVGSYIRIGP